MLVLGVETSCDETAAAVLQNGSDLLSNIIASQNDVHSKYGGIVPELAGRSHIERIDSILHQAIKKAGVSFQDLDLIAATQGPGLVGSLLVGFNTAKALAYALQKPFLGINHLEGHLLAIFLEKAIPFPYIALTVSGGHTDLCLVKNFCDYQLLGRTRDDAAGESFDKVAKMMGLGYPGGPLIENKSKTGDPNAYRFPRAYLDKESLDFSFSGLKTSVRNLLQKRGYGNGQLSDEDIAASFQEAVAEVLVNKTVSACKREKIQNVVMTGGVAANSYLRERMKDVGQKEGFLTHFPKSVFCTDNGAMIACAAYYRYKTKPLPKDYMSLDAHANFAL